MTSDELVRVRLDKWLWAARFFKTRALAAAAIETGKVEVNGERAKRAKLLQQGIDPYGGRFEISETIAVARACHAQSVATPAAEREVRVAGRVMSHREGLRDSGGELETTEPRHREILRSPC